MQKVKGRRIYDKNKRVVWRGLGGDYLMHHTGDPTEPWRLNIDYILEKKVYNIIRLAFRFPWCVDSRSTAEPIELEKMEAIVNYLGSHKLKSILDYHGYEGLGSNNLRNSWVEVANYFKDNENVAAYQIFNEPSSSCWNSNITSRYEATEEHALLTKLIREVDSEHIVIWQSPAYYIDFFENIQELMQPNVVYTKHTWWTNQLENFNIYSPLEEAYKAINNSVYWSKLFNIPIWHGEFGASAGGNIFDPSKPEDEAARLLMHLCEEQNMGWNLWMGRATIDKPWSRYNSWFDKPFPSRVSRIKFNNPVPNLKDYIIFHQGIDYPDVYSLYYQIPYWGVYQVRLWHNKDFITLKPGVEVFVVTNRRLSDGSIEIVNEEIIPINKITTITNIEGTSEYPGDWNKRIYSLGYL